MLILQESSMTQGKKSTQARLRNRCSNNFEKPPKNKKRNKKAVTNSKKATFL